MGFRYRKSLRLIPGVRLNVTGKGLSSASFGKPGSTLNMGRGGIQSTVGLPGSGMSYASKRSGKSALFLGLLIAALVALIYHAARGSRAAQVSLLVIGVLGVGAALMAQNSDTKSGAAPNLTLAPRTDRQEPGQPQLLPPASRDISPSNPLPYVEAAKGPVQQDAPVGDSWPTFAGDQRTPSTSSGTDLGSSVAVEQPLGVQFPTAVVTRTANIRSDPSMAGAVMGQVSAGTTLTVVEINGRWARVSKDEVPLGWINRSLMAAQPSYTGLLPPGLL
ncbi:MAG: DUF4236 domain-containing protein [Mesorhizobium sp.]|uniref:DUF4236 domain-containing protein n=1 Tax=Mesorhizobium sp. TaxID=1871066 RepID=UPI000FE9C4EF|nr:DUF4236 domain-containing protein [Mesorhizobium sp.]RWD32154.1 MAG: DUF4236 domain-containing protein [Mesorhizobium sp.]RWQ47396.1 MAG: DUF4236 domain-containing protein [Mesorhizobium sp.]TKB97272.1 MAG: DUF4236 domain-containing protein [Mesorhizobium sp.]